MQFYKNTKNETITQNLKKIDENKKKHGFWSSDTKTDVAIKFYANNYPCRLIFKSVQLNIAENMSLIVCKRMYTIVDVYSGFVTLFFHGGVGPRTSTYVDVCRRTSTNVDDVVRCRALMYVDVGRHRST